GWGIAGAKVLFSSTSLEPTMLQSIQLRADEVLGSSSQPCSLLYIDLEGTEFRRQLEEAGWIQVGITHLQHHVSPLLPAVLAQAINQRLQHRWSLRRVR